MTRGDLFRELVIAEERQPARVGLGWRISVTTHALVAAALVLPLLWSRARPQVAPAPLVAFALLPAPPAAPRGDGRSSKTRANDPTIQRPAAHPREDVEPLREALPTEELPAPEPVRLQDMQSVGPVGNTPGDPDGIIGADGEHGGQPRGCFGCSGENPVANYDQPPLLTIRTQPIYPQDAFVKRTQGVVVLEILIDSTGNVASARVTSSSPLFDQAATACVLQWKFRPAQKQGRSVAALASATVTFRIH